MRATEKLVLVVDDDRLVGNAVRRMLDRLGYTTDVYTAGWEALRVFASDPDKFQAVITDLTMPQMTGLQLAERLTSIRPKLGIILISGRCDSLTPEITARAGIRHVLPKPFGLAEIDGLLKGIIDDETN